MDLQKVHEAFINECDELLDNMDNDILELQRNNVSEEHINGLFRTVHTLKGTSGVFGFDGVMAFTHVLENALELLREGDITFNDELADLLFACRDHIQCLIDVSTQGLELSSELRATDSDLLERIRQYAQLTEAPVEVNAKSNTQDDPSTTQSWQITAQFSVDLFRGGFDPLSFIRYIEQIGTIEHREVLFDESVAFKDFDPESCYCQYNLNVTTSAPKSELEEVFEFVMEDCELQVQPIENDQASSESSGLGAGKKNVASVDNASPIKTRSMAKKSLRIDADRLDELVNNVGELVISSARTQMLANQMSSESLVSAVAESTRLVEIIRDITLRLRMVQIGDTFARFQKVVYQVSRDIGKDIQLEISGGDTEMDKSLIEKLNDPLMHLVRNAIDHGIEAKEEREKTDKPKVATIQLKAYRDAGNIIIEIIDDGKGLNKEKIIAKAIDKGLMSSANELDDQDIYNLIFAPGFSTKDQVSDLSGRGVGMDVVKSSLESIHGSVDIHSEEGMGTRVTIRLPLTLAIIDGFLVKIGGDFYIVPFDCVAECIELPANYLEENNNHYIHLRGDMLSLIRMDILFDACQASDCQKNIVVVESSEAKAGLVVDELLGEFQTVIKPLGDIFDNLRGISGSTILGNGEVALIVEPLELIHYAKKMNQLLSSESSAVNS